MLITEIIIFYWTMHICQGMYVTHIFPDNYRQVILSQTEYHLLSLPWW
jgi:hypothetical protein